MDVGAGQPMTEDWLLATSRLRSRKTFRDALAFFVEHGLVVPERLPGASWGGSDRGPHRRAGSARASARTRASARRNGRRRRDAVRLAQAVRAGQQFRRRQPVAGPPRAPAAIRLSGGPLRRCSRASDHAAAPAWGTLLRRRAARTPGKPSLGAVEWEMFLADAVVETHDRIVGRTYRTAVRTCEAQLGDETAAVREALRSFADLGSALIGARDTGAALDAVIANRPGWEGLGDLVATAAALHAAHAADAGYRGVARGQALAGSRRRPAQHVPAQPTSTSARPVG